MLFSFFFTIQIEMRIQCVPSTIVIFISKTSSQDEESIMSSKDGGFWVSLEKPDRRILIFFFSCLVIIITSIILINILSLQANFVSFVFSVLAGFVVTLSITGILVVVYYYKRAIISTRKVLLWFIIFALIFSAIANIVIYLLSQMQYFGSSTVFLFNFDTVSVYNIMLQFFGVFLFTLFVEIDLMFQAFGLIWLLAVVEKSTIPDTLVDITKITSITSKLIPKKDKSNRRRYLMLQWLFNIPDVLDTKLFTINFEQEQSFPWKTLKTAFIWVSILSFLIAMVIANYITSFAKISIENLLVISGLITTMTPIIVFSWFIFRKMDARIKGPVNDFKLYNGLKSRTTSYTVTFGTIILLLRLAIIKTDLNQLFWLFTSYYPLFLVSSIIITFVYFNYFENDLANNIVNRYREIK